jgi:cellulose synthase/poly-beta-1,6-N-acetylglucosamine synthase-like glycosyltransferase
MESLINIVLVALALVLCVPVLVLAVEVGSALLFGDSRRHPSSPLGKRVPVVVLVPAHDEGKHILPTLADIKAQLTPGDRLLVVADNCSDDTAAIARAAGATVIERQDPHRRGKGFALDFGLRHLASLPPGVVIVIDADCRLGPELIALLSSRCAATRRPVQALYLMRAPEPSRVTQRIAAFAWLIKNRVRPLGLGALGLPSNLLGTGMALPWSATEHVTLATPHLVEDVQLGLGLAMHGYPPVFCSRALVESRFPDTLAASVVQRRRWESGSLQIVLRAAPRVLLQAWKQLDAGLLALGLDNLIPPLGLLAALLLLGFAISLLGGFAGLPLTPAYVSAAALVLFAATMIAAWAGFGRDTVHARDVLYLPAYLLEKVRIHRLFSRRTPAEWTRTERG